MIKIWDFGTNSVQCQVNIVSISGHECFKMLPFHPDLIIKTARYLMSSDCISAILIIKMNIIVQNSRL